MNLHHLVKTLQIWNFMNYVMKNKFYKYIQELQEVITSKLEEVDGKAKFQEDLWKRPEGGGGRTRVIENGNVFEKGGVNISAVHGELPETMRKHFGVKDANFFACGQDLTPYYLFEGDAKHFHQTCKTACDKHNPDFYPKCKARCDEYFYNSHRNEARGIGGLFFDYCKASDEMSMENWYNFVTE